MFPEEHLKTAHALAYGDAGFAALEPDAPTAVRSRLSPVDRSLRDITTGLEHAGLAAILCDPDGAVHAMTGLAEALVAAGRLLIVRRGRLSAVRLHDDRHLRRGLARAAASSGGGTEDLVVGQDGRRIALRIRALPATTWDLVCPPRLLVIVREGPRVPSEQILRIAFGLTVAEAEIALALSQGHPREVIAIRRGVTIGTLRQQIKTIQAKVGVSREVELVLAVHRLG